MKTIIPDGRGSIQYIEIDEPALFPHALKCRMTHSLISSGTERGIIQRYNGIMIDEIKQRDIRLGYCGTGIVEEIGDEVDGFTQGMRVAYYGGPWVSHSEYVVVPSHLCFHIPDGLEFSHAVFMGIAAIAMHGFRRAGIGLGDVCLVAGAGIIGNLCAQIALIAGCHVAVSEREALRRDGMMKCAGGFNDLACITPDDAMDTINDMSHGVGADAVFLCMSTDSKEPMQQALEIVRPGGKIVVLGVLDISVPRELFFIKEPEITISRATGPGRYDMAYEHDGYDYPIQYVRWTEGRNLSESLELISAGRLKVQPLIAGIVPVADAAGAYASILASAPPLAYILEW